jgi:diguanylate cyclase (GGDEF)-like protein
MLANGRVTARHLGVGDGLPNENVDGLAQDAAGRIWAATDRRLAEIDPSTLRARAFGLADGTTDLGYWGGAVAQSGDGTIFFGGGDGVTILAPGASSPWTYDPPVLVTGLHAGGAPANAYDLNQREALDLPSQHRDLSVEFAALDYSGPRELQYAYRLDGYDRDWIFTDAEHRLATYTNLPPGRYTLEVRGTNRLGAWSVRTLNVRFRAQAAWYETWWFRVAIACATVLLLLLALKTRTAMLERRQRELESIVRLHTKQLSQANIALEEMSLTDPLTGLRNRRFLVQQVEGEAAMVLRGYDDWLEQTDDAEPHPADLLFFLIDIDHFKDVNDEFGHGAGDEILTHLRERLEEVFRHSDYLIRWGGEEFLAVARGLRREDAPDLAERLRIAVERRPFTLSTGRTIVKTISIGFASFPVLERDPHAYTWWQAIESADRALYVAKEAGRNRWVDSQTV